MPRRPGHLLGRTAREQDALGAGHARHRHRHSHRHAHGRGHQRLEPGVHPQRLRAGRECVLCVALQMVQQFLRRLVEHAAAPANHPRRGGKRGPAADARPSRRAHGVRRRHGEIPEPQRRQRGNQRHDGSLPANQRRGHGGRPVPDRRRRRRHPADLRHRQRRRHKPVSRRVAPRQTHPHRGPLVSSRWRPAKTGHDVRQQPRQPHRRSAPGIFDGHLEPARHYNPGQGRLGGATSTKPRRNCAR